jgi:hypothetical protein
MAVAGSGITKLLPIALSVESGITNPYFRAWCHGCFTQLAFSVIAILPIEVYTMFQATQSIGRIRYAVDRTIRHRIHDSIAGGD